MSDIQIALSEISSKGRQTALYLDYYNGRHQLAFSSKSFNNAFGNMLTGMKENLCRIVVDAPADRMEIINFSSGDAKKTTAKRAWEIWQREQMELESFDVHRGAFGAGDSFLLVGQTEDGKAQFFVQRHPENCALLRDDEFNNPLFGAKLWIVNDKQYRLNLYYADRFEKYITRDNFKASSDMLKGESFIEYNTPTESFITLNDTGIIPMFQFSTEPVLADAITLQNRLNKTICSEMVAEEFGAYPQKYATGLTPPADEITGQKKTPFQAGIDRMWMTDSPDVKFGQFQTTDLEQFLKVEDAVRLSIARVTGTPLHFFSFTTSDAMSGEALKTLESRFTHRVKRAALSFGAVWGKAMKLALQIEGLTVATDVTVQWESPEQRSETELLDNQLKKIQLGVPQDVLLEEVGYSAEDLVRFEQLRKEEMAMFQADNVANEEVAINE